MDEFNTNTSSLVFRKASLHLLTERWVGDQSDGYSGKGFQKAIETEANHHHHRQEQALSELQDV